MKEYGRLCSDCNTPENFLPPVPETKTDYSRISSAESEMADGPDCGIASHYWACSDCGEKTHFGFNHLCGAKPLTF
jgi:hypothetical protein